MCTPSAMSRFSVKETPGGGSQSLYSRSKQVNGTQDTGAESHCGWQDGWCGVLLSSPRLRPSRFAGSPAPRIGRVLGLPVPGSHSSLPPQGTSLVNAWRVRGSWSPEEGLVGYGRVGAAPKVEAGADRRGGWAGSAEQAGK